MTDPKAAAGELFRCVRELGFVGALVDNHLENGRFYDDEHFWPVFEASQELDVPIYLHPTFASDTMLEHYKGNYDENIATALSALDGAGMPKLDCISCVFIAVDFSTDIPS
jgi:predicted TIM-barrel fold metal-dependent hydrolase